MLDIGVHMLAPCGMNCSFCYVHHKSKKPCNGCRAFDNSQPKSCRNCKIKDCVTEHRYEFCSQCSDFSCALLKRLDKNYKNRYKQSLIINLKMIVETGADALIQKHQAEFRCPVCSGYINMHDRICLECGNIAANN